MPRAWGTLELITRITRMRVYGAPRTSIIAGNRKTIFKTTTIGLRYRLVSCPALLSEFCVLCRVSLSLPLPFTDKASCTVSKQIQQSYKRDLQLTPMTCYPSALMDCAWMQQNVRQRLTSSHITQVSYFNNPTNFIDIAATNISAIASRFSRKPYITQEVIWGYQEPIQPSEYVGIGTLLSSQFWIGCTDTYTFR